MFCIDNNELKWNVDYLCNNPNFQPTNKIYKNFDNHVIIFITEKESHNYHNNCMVYYASKGFTLKNNIIQRVLFNQQCYFCGGCLTEMNKIYKKGDEYCLCSGCVTQWNMVKDNVKTTKTNNLFEITIKSGSTKIYDAIFHLDIHTYIIYSRLIVPIEKYEYFKLLSTWELSDQCDICCDYEFDIYEAYDYYGYGFNLICQQCLNHAFKTFVENNYVKYMLINSLNELNDTRSLIIKELIKIK
jgi:hypothetical protein